MLNNFVHTHVHTDASLLDGLSKVKDLVAKAKSLNMKAVAITDHGSLGNAYSFWNECNANGIKPLLGNELYYTHDTNILSLPLKERDAITIAKAKKNGVEIPKKAKKKDIAELLEPYSYDTKGYHILFIAMNQIGWINLMKLSGEASDKCTYNGRPHCDMDMIRKYNEGLICTTACLGSYLDQCIVNDDIDNAKQYLLELRDIFEDRLFLEIQPLNDKDQIKVNIELMKLSEELDIKLITGVDSHYVNKDDHYIHDILLCIGTGSKLSDEVRFRFENEFWFMSYEEVIEQYQFPPIDLLSKPVMKNIQNSEEELQQTADKLKTTLESFGVRVTISNVSRGPSVTRYELQPEQGVKVSKITGLADDIKLNLAAADVRIEAPIPGKAAVGIEVPNKENTAVLLRELIESNEFFNHNSNIGFLVVSNIL